MAKFFVNSNNGVTAVIREDHAELYKTIKQAGGNPVKGGTVKVFTFHSVSPDVLHHAQEFPFQYAMYTGNSDDLQWLIEQGGHEIIEGTGPWDGYVPFSNGFNMAELHEAEYTTTMMNVRKIFFS